MCLPCWYSWPFSAPSSPRRFCDCISVKSATNTSCSRTYDLALVIVAGHRRARRQKNLVIRGDTRPPLDPTPLTAGPKKTVVIDGDTGRAWTAAQLTAEAEHLATMFRGPYVPICQPNSALWLATFLAIQKIGA